MDSTIRPSATLLTPVELASRWSVPLSRIYKMNHVNNHAPEEQPALRAVKLGRLVRYRLSDVEAWEESNYTGSGQQ